MVLQSTPRGPIGGRHPLRWAGLALLAVGLAVQAGEGPAPYQFGVFPHLTTTRLEQIFAPVAADFSHVLKRPVYFRTRSTFAGFTRELEQETYDIALVQPFDYVRIHDRYGYRPLARRGEPLAAVIMVLPDSPARTLADLAGKTIALPPRVAAVSHLTRIALLRAGLEPGRDVRLQYNRSHDSCLQLLLIGRVAACGTAANPVRFFQAKMKVTFRRLAESPQIPHVLFVAHPRVPAADRAMLRKTIVSWPETPAGRRILAGGIARPFVAVVDEEYDTVREIAGQIESR